MSRGRLPTKNGRHDVVVVDVDDAELPMGFARLFIQKRRQQYVHQHRQKQDPRRRRRPLCEKGLSQSKCVLCVLCDDDDVVISLSLLDLMFSIRYTCTKVFKKRPNPSS